MRRSNNRYEIGWKTGLAIIAICAAVGAVGGAIAGSYLPAGGTIVGCGLGLGAGAAAGLFLGVAIISLWNPLVAPVLRGIHRGINSVINSINEIRERRALEAELVAKGRKSKAATAATAATAHKSKAEIDPDLIALREQACTAHRASVCSSSTTYTSSDESRTASPITVSESEIVDSGYTYSRRGTSDAAVNYYRGNGLRL